VAFEGMLSFDFPRTGERESFLGTGIGFHFWHYGWMLNIGY